MLSLVRSVQNSLAPINRIPPDVLSFIPDYCHADDADQDLIALSHVCRHWRDVFISRSSLWTQLDFMNIDQTGAYIQRSRSSSLEVYLAKDGDDTYLDDTERSEVKLVPTRCAVGVGGNGLVPAP